MSKKKPRHKKLVRTTLTKEVADNLVGKVLRGEPLFTDEQYNNNDAVEIPIKDGVFYLKPATYRAWMRLRTKIPETGRVFYQLMQEARHQRAMKKHEEAQAEIVKEAQRTLREIQNMPVSTRTVRRLRKFRIIEGERKVQTHEEQEEIETPVDSRIVAAKQKGGEFFLTKLDPKYASKDGNANVNVMVNLADLRKAKEEREGTKSATQKPDGRYEVNE